MLLRAAGAARLTGGNAHVFGLSILYGAGDDDGDDGDDGDD